VTGKLSRPPDNIVDSYPDVCPKCGATLGLRRTLPDSVRSHFERAHPKSIGTARYQNGPVLFDFGFVGPVSGVTRRRWWVVSFAWPFGLVTIAPDEWTIVWADRTDPTEGVPG
jgi:hypothetical protein